MDLFEQTQTEPPIAGDDAAMLLGYLERQRATFAWKIDGLDAAGLRATVGGSTMTLGGMLKHLARIEDEMAHKWLLGQGRSAPWDGVDWDREHEWDWRTALNDSPEQLYAGWRDAVERARVIFGEALADGGLEQSARGVTNEQGDAPNLRYVLLTLMEEYARHNGHADLIRESVDGLVGHDRPG
jgi:hypothetical protein